MEDSPTPTDVEVVEATPSVEAPPTSTPPWGSDEDFNAERAWELIQNLRSDKDSLKTKADEYSSKVREYEDAKLTVEQKAARDLKEQQESYATLASENALLKAAIEHGLSADDMELLRGLPADAIAERAAKLAARLVGTGAPKQNPLIRQPKEALRGGSTPNTPNETGDWLRQALAKTDSL